MGNIMFDYVMKSNNRKKLLNFDYIPMQMYTSDYLRKIFTLMYIIFLIIHSEY